VLSRVERPSRVRLWHLADVEPALCHFRCWSNQRSNGVLTIGKGKKMPLLRDQQTRMDADAILCGSSEKRRSANVVADTRSISGVNGPVEIAKVR
jgi:hypothetical protein